VFLVFLESAAPSPAVSVFRRSTVLTKGAPNSMVDLVFASMCLTLNLPTQVPSLTLQREGERTYVVQERGVDAAPASRRKNVYSPCHLALQA